ncbi:hypothetical protein [Clostridium sp.]|nr:hypothetical protein [Clostridium sp.]MDR3597064.1 hypothetical protein [Clostridium sp.]
MNDMENKNYNNFITFMAEMVQKYGAEVLAELEAENSEVQKDC